MKRSSILQEFVQHNHRGKHLSFPILLLIYFQLCRFDQTLKDIQTDNIGSKLVTEAQLGKIDVFHDDCVAQILEVLDKHFKEDDLALKKKAGKKFIKFKRNKDQNIDEYIDSYDEACANLRKAGRDLDDETYALQLIESSNLTEELSQLVISGINDKQPEIFEQTKKSMRKYLGSDKTGISINEKVKVKDEVYVSENFYNDEEALYNATRYHNFGGRKGRAGQRGGSKGGRGRGDFRNNGSGAGQIAKSSMSKDQNRRRRQLNPPDENGQSQKCFICGSIFHFAGKNGKNCSESYENIQGVYKADPDTEEANKCEECDLKEVFAVEGLNDECLLDSCCTSNVMGQYWKEKFFQNFSDDDLVQVKSSAKYRFGGEGPVAAVERIEFPCYILGERTNIVADVVDSDIPFLMSKAEMKKRGFSIEFNSDTLHVNGKSYDLATTYNGHFKLNLWKQEEVNISYRNVSD